MRLNRPHPLLPAPLATLLLLLSPSPSAAASPKSGPKSKILLSSVQTLTLRSGALTAHRRVPAVPQLRCVSPPAVCALHEVDVMRCANQGAGYDGAEDVQWTCTASLPPELRLGSTDVACEGYAGPDDPYVLKGSCGVEYRLALTELGERKFPDIANGGGGWGTGGEGGAGLGDADISAWLFGIIFVGVCIWILYSAFFAAQENRRAPRRPRNGFGGGGGGGGFDPGYGPGGGGDGGGYGGFQDDPPPPYPGTKPSSSTAAPAPAQAGGWRPGFWSGLAGGAAAGYYASRNNNSRTDNSYRQEPRNYGSSWGSSSSSGSSPSSSSWGSGSRSTSSARHESTGFGSTSRR